MTRLEVTKSRAATAAFFLFAAALALGLALGATRAEASLPTSADAATLNLAVPDADTLALEASATILRSAVAADVDDVALEHSPDSAPHLGFADDLCLLDPDHAQAGFAIFGRETCRCERTYARNNPLTYVDPDGRATHPVTGGSGIPDGTVRRNSANPRVGYFGFVRNGGTKFHHGVDLTARIGTQLVAPISGVVSVSSGPVGGLSVAVQREDGVRISMFHLSGSSVESGSRILEGMPIAASGNSGNANGLTATGEDHVHLGVAVKGAEADPVQYFDQNRSMIQPMVANGVGMGAAATPLGLGGASLVPAPASSGCGRDEPCRVVATLAPAM